jgi:asparagine synthase (glutamine-hydrolysing)
MLDKLRRRWVEARVSAISRAVRADRLTYLSFQKLRNIERALYRIDADGVQGDCLETGVALGGSAIVIASLMSGDRRFSGYDVFGMIPSPGDRDDDVSHERYRVIARGASQGIGGEEYYGYRADLYRDVVAAFARHDVPVDGERVSLHRGLFEHTLRFSDGNRVALAHIDCDWHDPVRLCLEQIYEVLSPGGYLISDEYHTYGGCRRAVDDFLASHPDVSISTDAESLVMRRSAPGR